MIDLSSVHPVISTDEKQLAHHLYSSLYENAYLLGLIQDYSVRDLAEMDWGRFYWCSFNGEIEGVLYLDVTGLAVLDNASPRSIRVFAELIQENQMHLGRVIARKEVAEYLDQCLKKLDPRWRWVSQAFEEVGMILDRSSLTSYQEPRLRLANAWEARDVAAGSARAMEEELNLCTGVDEFERLYRSKVDLIKRKRYYILREEDRILFQAFLCASLPDVGLIQGVWVPAEFRKQGIATRCMAQMCRECLKHSENLILRVQKRNYAAHAVYSKTGFQPFMDYLSIWYDNPSGL